MPRNLDHRVEVLFPVRDSELRRAIAEDILAVHLGDNVNARELLEDGTWEHVTAEGTPLDSQQWMIDNRGKWSEST